MKPVIWGVGVIAACVLLLSPRGYEVTAKCKDGTISSSKNRQGTCSKHGGVVEWVKK